LTARAKPITFKVTTICDDGTVETTTLSFAFDANGRIGMDESELGDDIRQPARLF
jgi:hypothetical protein